MLAGKTGVGMDEMGLQPQGKYKKMGTVFLGVLKPEEGTPRVFATAAESPFERLHLLGAALSRVLCPLLPDAGDEERL